MTVESRLAVVEQMITAGEFVSAETTVKEILQDHPNHPAAQHLLGLIAYQVGEHEKSIEIISTVCAAYPDYVDALFNLASMLREQGRFIEAINYYQQVLVFRSTDLVVLEFLGTLYRQQGQFKEALDCYRQIVAADPENADVHLTLGNLYFEENNRDKAFDHFKLSLLYNSESTIAHYNYATCLASASKFKEAIYHFNNAIRLSPDNLSAVIRLGIVLIEYGQLEPAGEAFAKALQLDPKNPDLYVYLGNAMNGIGKLKAAKENFFEALKNDPNHVDAKFMLYGNLLSGDTLEPAANMVEEILVHEPTNYKMHYYLGLTREFQGNQSLAKYHQDIIRKNHGELQNLYEAWLYISSVRSAKTKLLGTIHEMLEIGMDAAQNDGLNLEFGVRFGNSIRQLAEMTDQNIHGFDTFSGLPEEWHGWPEGAYTTDGELPAVPKNVHLYAGTFSESLPSFLKENPGPIRYMNVDCDLYSSTKDIFDHVSARIVPGTVILFDEYISQPHWQEDEFRAFQDAAKLNNWKYEYLAFSPLTFQAVVIMR